MNWVELRLIAEKGKRKTRARNGRKRVEDGSRTGLRRTTVVIASLHFIHAEKYHHLLIPNVRACGILDTYQHSKTWKVKSLPYFHPQGKCTKHIYKKSTDRPRVEQSNPNLDILRDDVNISTVSCPRRRLQRIDIVSPPWACTPPHRAQPHIIRSNESIKHPGDSSLAL